MGPKICVWFNIQNLPKIFLILKRIQRDVFINLSVRLDLFQLTLFFLEDFRKKHLNIRFHESPSSGN